LLLSFRTKKHNVISLSKTILKKFPLLRLAETTVAELKKVDGMGEVKAGKVLAAIELGRRSIEHESRLAIHSMNDVLLHVHDIRREHREHLVALYLNARNELIAKHTIAVGSLNQNVIEPRDVFAEALKAPCASIILVHNHPSGDAEPSDQDIHFTKNLMQAGKLLGIEILDHIVVSENGECSLKSQNLV
jgi:DNA repair protein RadC